MNGKFLAALAMIIAYKTIPHFLSLQELKQKWYGLARLGLLAVLVSLAEFILAIKQCTFYWLISLDNS